MKRTLIALFALFTILSLTIAPSYAAHLADGNPLATCVLDASGVAQTVVATPNERFVQRWDIKNAGTCQWQTTHQLTFIRGDKLSILDQIGLVRDIRAGSSANFWTQLIAPTTIGEYESVWQMQDKNGNLFGDEIVTRLVVADQYETKPTTGNEPQTTVVEQSTTIEETTYTANRYRLDFTSPSAKLTAETYLNTNLTIRNSVLTFNESSCTLDESNSRRVDTGSYLVHTYGRSPGSLAFAPGAMTIVTCGSLGEVMFTQNYNKTPQIVLRLDGMFIYFLQN